MGKAKSLNCRILALGGMPDHLHAVVRMHPATSVARLAQELKGASSYHINHVLRPEEKLRWQGGYGAFTCWERGIGVVVKYVETQRTRHASALWMPWRTLTTSAVADGPMLVEEWERAGELDSPHGSITSGNSDDSIQADG